MAEKPRVKAPKQRGAAKQPATSRRSLGVVALVTGLALFVGVGAAVLAFSGGTKASDVASVRTALESSGCSLQMVKALRGAHSILQPGGTSKKWNTDPPTNGPHYAIPAIFGRYSDELEPARVVHNLEHGGIFILYGSDVPAATVDQLGAFYDDHQTGTIMAPLDKLGKQFALGAWVVDGEIDNAFLARCTRYDEGAASSFFRTLQFRGPERFDPSRLRPGM